MLIIQYALPTNKGFVECDIGTEKLRNVLVSILLNLVLIGSLNVFHDDECEIEMREETQYPVTLRQNKTCSGFILKIFFFFWRQPKRWETSMSIFMFFHETIEAEEMTLLIPELNIGTRAVNGPSQSQRSY